MNPAITIVSGLPRSGTSMMMRMLEAGGMELVTDNIRKADDDNPRGYFEFEKVKKIKEDSSWLQETAGKVFKMVSMLLYDLPPDRRYRIIFMKRNMKEIMTSQRVMLERLGRSGGSVSDDEMAKLSEKHLEQIEKWLDLQPNIEVLTVHYNEVIQNPSENAEKVNRFLSNALDVEKMVEAIDQSLYRNRVQPGI